MFQNNFLKEFPRRTVGRLLIISVSISIVVQIKVLLLKSLFVAFVVDFGSSCTIAARELQQSTSTMEQFMRATIYAVVLSYISRFD